MYDQKIVLMVIPQHAWPHGGVDIYPIKNSCDLGYDHDGHEGRRVDGLRYKYCLFFIVHEYNVHRGLVTHPVVHLQDL